MIGATSGAGTAYPSVGPEFRLVFRGGGGGVHVAQSSVFCVVLCQSLFVCPSSNYGSRLPHWYLEIFLVVHFLLNIKILRENKKKTYPTDGGKIGSCCCGGAGPSPSKPGVFSCLDSISCNKYVIMVIQCSSGNTFFFEYRKQSMRF